MNSEIPSQRVPWVALVLSFLSAGVGHLYCGRIAKGLWLYFAWLLFPLCVTFAAIRPPSNSVLMTLMLLPAVVALVVYLYAAIDAWRLAGQTGSNYSLRDYNRAGIYLLLIAVQLVFSTSLIAGVRGSVYEAFVIPVSNMNPSILEGDRVLARKLSPLDDIPEHGDLVVYRNPMPTGATRFIGRVVAVAGDHVKISGERLLINGNELQRDRVAGENLKRFGNQVRGRVAYEANAGHRYLVTYGDISDSGESQPDFEATIPERHVFVLGDNRDRSRDSRHFGSIQMADVVGYVDYIFWPSESWSRFGVAAE